MYKRAKREDFFKEESKVMSVNIGTTKDSYDELCKMCNDKSIEMLRSLDLSANAKVQVTFWTSDFPELIGVSTFNYNAAGYHTYSFDNSCTTL